MCKILEFADVYIVPRTSFSSQFSHCLLHWAFPTKAHLCWTTYLILMKRTEYQALHTNFTSQSPFANSTVAADFFNEVEDGLSFAELYWTCICLCKQSVRLLQHTVPDGICDPTVHKTQVIQDAAAWFITAICRVQQTTSISVTSYQ